MKNPLHVFVDTNVFLHYPPLSQIDWPALCDADEVHLVVCLAVIQELDAKKSDTRLASRAQRAIKEIREAQRGGALIRDKVGLSIFNQELRYSDFPASLSPDSGDDKIVHLAKVYSEHNPGLTVAIATEDFGMELRCNAGGVSAIYMDSALRLDNPQDELSRKHRQVSQELAALKNRLPRLLLGIAKPGDDAFNVSPPLFEVNELGSARDFESELNQERKRLPKRAGGRNPTKPLSATELLLASTLESDPHRRGYEQKLKVYDNELEEYFEKYRAYLNQKNVQASAKARSVTFDLVLKNDGNGPATDIDVVIRWPSVIRWIGESGSSGAKLLEEPIPAPRPPEIPPLFDIGRLLGRSDLIGLRTNLPDLRFVRRDELTPVATAVKTAEEIWEVRVRIPKLKHGHSIVLGTFLAVFASWDDAKSFSVPFVLSVCELSDKLLGQLPIVVQKVSERV